MLHGHFLSLASSYNTEEHEVSSVVMLVHD